MRAVLYDRYGGIDVLHLGERADPVPRDNEAIVDVRAAALNPKDALFRKGKFRLVSGARFPKQIGVDFAGIVRAAGPKAGVSPGERVFGALTEWRYDRGTLAERVRVRANELAPLPDVVDFEHGAALPLTGLTALQALRDIARVHLGDLVAVHGASGGVGTIAVQIARVLGARVITTSSAANLEMCKSLGAEEALDYTASPLEKPRGDLACIFDVFGDLRFDRVKGALRRGGVYITTVPSPAAFLRDMASRVWGPCRFARAHVVARSSRGRRRLVIVRSRRADLETLGAWAAARRIRPAIDSTRPLAEFAEAFRVLESKRARGKLVLTVP